MTSRDELLAQLRAMPSSLNDAMRTMEMAADFITRQAQRTPDREALEKLIQRHAFAYIARGGAISDSIIAECKASRDALLAALSAVTSTHLWPAGCHDPDSCAHHKACMYIQCRNNGRDIAGEVETATSTNGFTLHVRSEEQP